MLLKALNFKKGDEIITVSNSFIATCGAIVMSGCKPILVDIKNDLNIDPALIEKKISKKTKAIMPVHLSGIPANLKALKKICKKHKLILLEDAAHAFGIKYYNQYLGTIGKVGVFSLHPRKSFHVFGDGGLIVTNDTKLYKKIIDIDVNNFDALNLLGILCCQYKKFNEGLKYFNKAIKINGFCKNPFES